MQPINHGVLGKDTKYCNQYAPELLFPISRKPNRGELGFVSEPNFFGADIWRAFEFSWLNSKGKPIVAMAEFVFDCLTPYLIESKSFKLYLNSFSGTRFSSVEEVVSVLKQDLSKASGGKVGVLLKLLNEISDEKLAQPEGICLDDLDVECSIYHPDASLLYVEDNLTEEKLFSHLLKSNCPVTGQPDWASIEIVYQGPQINYESLLKYIVSYRDHTEFHEQCVERMFVDIMSQCKPNRLMIHAHYTRRGGLDINPFRSTHPINFSKKRLVRQ